MVGRVVNDELCRFCVDCIILPFHVEQENGLIVRGYVHVYNAQLILPRCFCDPRQLTIECLHPELELNSIPISKDYPGP